MRTLILCPLIVTKNWKDEFLKFSKVQGRDILVLTKSGKRREKDLYDATFDGQGLTRGKIGITNYESMQMESFVKMLHEWNPEILVCDESHRLKNFKSKRAKEVVKLSDEAQHVYILTGTPIINNPLDVYNQFRVLDGGSTFGQNPYIFRNTFLEDENSAWAGKQNYFPKWVPRPEKFPELNDRIYKKAIRVVKDECMDLPPLVRQTVHVELSAEQERMYKEMRDEYVTYVESLKKSSEPFAVIAQLAITKSLRLQQIVSGYAKDVNNGIHWIKENPRLHALGELCEDLVDQHKVIIWATFRENYKMIGEMLTKMKVPYAELHGEISKGERDEMVRRFRQDQDCRVIVANQAAAGIGINLTEASYSLFYSRNFSLEQDLQAEARNYRGGSEMHRSVTRVDLVAPNTIDELISDALAKKQDVATKILDWRL